jgi:hypothetical protein
MQAILPKQALLKFEVLITFSIVGNTLCLEPIQKSQQQQISFS